VGELRAYAALLGGQFRSMASYRTSFVIELVSNIGATVIDLMTIFVIYYGATEVGGFTFRETLMMTAITVAGFVLADFAVGNVERLKLYVRAGTLDAVLVRPLRVLPQLLLLDLPVRKTLRLVVGLSSIVLAVRLNDLDWTPARLLLLIVAPAAAAVFFGSIFVISASLAFWWVESGEVGNAFTYGGRDFASYPVTVFDGWFRAVFAYGLGFAFVGYQPALALLGRADPLGLQSWAGYLSPLVALVAAVLAALVWRTGVRHYRSTGS
jgi:ABC-2 type transport system permease protein